MAALLLRRTACMPSRMHPCSDMHQISQVHLCRCRLQPDPEVVHHLVTALSAKLAGYSRGELLQLVAAFRRIFRILPGRPLQALVAEMRRRATYMEQQERLWQ
jgi:hypothetical protein